MQLSRLVPALTHLLSAARRLALAACSLALAGAAAPAGRAEDQPWDFTLTVENDYFGGTDQHYTNGIRLAFDQPFVPVENGSWRWPKLPALGLTPVSDRFGLAVSQHMYTPRKITARQLLVNDRPYAGWLYLSEVYERIGRTAGKRLVGDRFELSLGVVGPWAQAGEVQWWWHRDVTGSPLPRGWDNQLANEPTVQFLAARTVQLRFTPASQRFGCDLLPRVGLALGNVHLNAGAGARFRLGFNLPEEFSGQGPLPAAMPVPASLNAPFRAAPTADSKPRPTRPHAFLFVGAESRAIARNLFLDGNTWRDSHRVDREPLVTDFTAGAAVRIRRLEATYTYVRRTREFTGGPDYQDFASITLGCRH